MKSSGFKLYGYEIEKSGVFQFGITSKFKIKGHPTAKVEH